MSTDPYATPKSFVEDAPGAAIDAEFVPGGQRVAGGRGWDWIAQGWELFRKDPGMWIVLFILFVVIFGAVSLIPVVGSVATFLFGPVLGAGIVVGCRTLEEGGNLQVLHLFVGFREKTGPLVAVGALYLAAWVVILLVVFLVAGAGVVALFMGASQGAGPASPGAVMGLLLAVLLALALSVPAMMAVWFAAPLVLFHDHSPAEAMKSSFRGCLKNVWPFLIYGLIVLVLSVPATILLGLGWLVLGPVIAASFYTSYRDIYTRNA